MTKVMHFFFGGGGGVTRWIRGDVQKENTR